MTAHEFSYVWQDFPGSNGEKKPWPVPKCVCGWEGGVAGTFAIAVERWAKHVGQETKKVWEERKGTS